MKDSKAGSCPNDGLAVARGFLGETPKAPSTIELNCLGGRQPMTCVPVPARVL